MRLEITLRNGLVTNCETSHPAVSKPMSIGRMGLYSSHSPGRSRVEAGSGVSSRSTPSSVAVRMASPLGAERCAITVVRAIRMAHVSSDCQVKMVLPKSRTPVTSSRAGGSDAAVACSCAAEDDKPRAQTAPRPMNAAAPSAR